MPLIGIFLFHVFIKSSMLPFLFMGHIHITAPFRSIDIGHRGWLGYAGPITPTLISWPQTFLHILSWNFLKFKRILINMCTYKGSVWMKILNRKVHSYESVFGWHSLVLRGCWLLKLPNLPRKWRKSCSSNWELAPCPQHGRQEHSLISIQSNWITW